MVMVKTDKLQLRRLHPSDIFYEPGWGAYSSKLHMPSDGSFTVMFFVKWWLERTWNGQE